MSENFNKEPKTEQAASSAVETIVMFRKQCNCEADLIGENVHIASEPFSHKISTTAETKWRCVNCGKVAIKKET